MADSAAPRVIVDSAIVENHWQMVTEADLAGIPMQGDIIVPLSFWLAHRDELLARPGRTAVFLQPGEEPHQIAGDLPHLPMIAIHFPVFSDGRGYSYARELRTRYGFKGEVRAIGDVLQDQLFYLRRVGFNAFAVRADTDIEEALEGLQGFSVTYQGDVADPRPFYRR